MGYIYILTSPNGKSYIGQTTRLIEKRLEEHRDGKSKACRAIYNAIKLHGWENFEIDWYYCPDDDLNKHEELMIEVLGTLAPGGYNLREGGGNGNLSEETKGKIRESNVGKKHSEESKQKMRKSMTTERIQNIRKTHLGKRTSEKTKQKLRKANLGKTYNETTKQKHREAMSGKNNPNYGKPKSVESKQKISGENNCKSKRVYQYDLDGNFIDSFGSTEEAGRYLGKEDGATIRKCASRKYKSAYNFKWSYVLDIFI